MGGKGGERRGKEKKGRTSAVRWAGELKRSPLPRSLPSGVGARMIDESGDSEYGRERRARSACRGRIEREQAEGGGRRGDAAIGHAHTVRAPEPGLECWAGDGRIVTGREGGPLG